MGDSRVNLQKEYGPNCIGNVIRILDKNTLIINSGTNAEMELGDIVQVYEFGEELKDLDGSTLANFEHVKGELKIIRVEPSFSVCKSNKTIKRTVQPFSLSPILEKEITDPVPLPVDETQIRPLEPSDPIIHVGDPVKLA